MTSQVSCQGHWQQLSDICVQFITPGNAPGPNSGPVGTFQWMRTVWKTRRVDDLSILDKRLNGVDGPVVFIARTMACHRTGASFTNLSKIQIHQTNTRYNFEKGQQFEIAKLRKTCGMHVYLEYPTYIKIQKHNII